MVTETDRRIIWSGIAIFTVLGLFGNVNVIFAHLKIPALRTKYGLLLMLLVICQSICICYEWVGIVYGLTSSTIVRKSCFTVLAPYVFMHCAQTGIMAAISTDLCLSIVFPLRHRVVRSRPYVSLLLLPTVIFGCTVIAIAVSSMDNEVIPLCQPPLSLPQPANQTWYLVGLLFNAETIITYTIAYSTIFFKKQRRFSASKGTDTGNAERKALKSLSLLLIVFIITRFLSTMLANILNLMGTDKGTISVAQSYMVLPAMACYSSSYYVCFARSAEYRKIFWRQLSRTLLCIGISLPEVQFGSTSDEVSRVRTTSMPITTTVSRKDTRY